MERLGLYRYGKTFGSGLKYLSVHLAACVLSVCLVCPYELGIFWRGGEWEVVFRILLIRSIPLFYRLFFSKVILSHFVFYFFEASNVKKFEDLCKLCSADEKPRVGF